MLSSAKGGRGGEAKHGRVYEKRRAVASTEELEIRPETLLAELQREIAHRGVRRVPKSESSGHS